MMGVVQSHRHHDMSSTDVGPAGKRLLDPELLQLYLAALLYFLFPFAAFLVFFLIGQSVAAVLKLNLCAKRPALTKVVTQVNHSMGNIEATMTGVVLVQLRLTVTTHVVTEIITREHSLAITAHSQARKFLCFFNAIFCCLSVNCQTGHND